MPQFFIVVESCLSIDANCLMREGILGAGQPCSGFYRWTYKNGRECSIGCAMVAPSGAEPLLRLSYSWTHPSTGEKEPVEYHVRLATTRPQFGGLRWWLVCPLLLGNGRACRRRVGKLYLPPHARYFGCRHCYRLTYTRCQQHDKRVDVLRRNPDVLRHLAANLNGASVAEMGLLLKTMKF